MAVGKNLGCLGRSRASIWTCAAIVCCFALQCPLAARDIYVNNVAGDDRADGSVREPIDPEHGPVRSIKRAVQLAQKYDRITLADTGTPYRECITLATSRNSGGEGFPFVLDGNGATLDGSAPIAVERWSGDRGDVLKFTPRKFTYPMLYLAGKPLTRVPVEPEAESRPELAPLEWCLFRREIYFCLEPGKNLYEYDLAEPKHDAGITLYRVQHVVVTDLVVQGFRLDGVQAADLTYDTALEHVVSRGNGRSGVAVVGASKLSLRGCLLGNNGAAQLWLEGYSQTQVFESQLLEGGSPVVRRAAETARLSIDGKKVEALELDSAPLPPVREE